MKLDWLVSFALLVATPLALEARTFDVRRDTFPFANETAWAYGVDGTGRLHMGARDRPARYAHRCFVLTRAVLQFYQFARFAPELPRISREEYRGLVRRLCRIPVWSGGPREPVVIPGFPNLRCFARSHQGLLQEELGNWFPTYIRPGNYRMAAGHPRAGQAAGARWLAAEAEHGRPRAIYISRFPHLNHALVVYRVRREPEGNLLFLLYDPNYPAEPARLRYVAARRSFHFERRWYFPGGQVNVMRIYLSPLH
ncbi:MAG: hypothetical protein M3463_22920 [Verrucomicrobiota bacterium]|nr:hypothetical protein [Verrucomicrobiota bacterium]